MEKLIEVFMESPEAGFALLKGMIEKYKPMAYDVAEIIMDIYKDFANNTEYPATVEKVKKNMISEWSKMDNEEGSRKYIQIQIDIRKYLKDSQNYQYSINSENIDDILPEQKVSTGGNNIIFVSIPFDLNRKSPFFAEFIVWEGEIVRAKIENLFKGLNGIYKSWVQDEWATSDEIKSELNIKISAILRKLQ